MTKLCQRVGVPRDTTRDSEVIPSSSTSIRRIETEYTREEVDMRRAAPADSTLEVDLDSLLLEKPLPTPTSKPSGTSTLSSSSQVPGASFSS